MLIKLLSKGNDKFKLIGATIGALIGFVLLLLSLQFYFDIKNIFSTNTDLISSDYLIINKKLSVFKTIDVSKSTFTNKDIKQIEQQEFVKEVCPFVASSFRVSAYTDKDSRIPYFYTDLFFEAIPDKYVDLKDEKWKWEINDSLIPIIIPKDYLNLYNFGFAQSQNLPQISDNIISLITFNLTIEGQQKKKHYEGKIIGCIDTIQMFQVSFPGDILKIIEEIKDETIVSAATRNSVADLN